MDLTADQLLVAGVAGVLEWRNTDAEGEPVAPAGAITIGVTRANGSTLVAAGTATTAVTGETGLYRYSLTAAQTATIDRLTVTWTDAGDLSAHTTTVDIIGGHLFTLPEARESDPEIGDRYDTAQLVDARADVTEEVEWICDRAFTRRYRRITVDGSGERELWLPDNDLRSIRAVSIDGTALTADELAELEVAEDHAVRMPAGDVWEWGTANIVIGYEYGLDRPYRHLKRAVLRRLRHHLHSAKSGVPDRATRFSMGDGGTFELDTATRFRTGIPDVDAVYGRYSKRATGEDGTTTGPASRSLDLDPQWGSLFHGGRR